MDELKAIFGYVKQLAMTKEFWIGGVLGVAQEKYGLVGHLLGLLRHLIG